jgi:putative ABC transport system ATP-binding protein
MESMDMPEAAVSMRGVSREFFDGRVTRTVVKELDLDFMTGELTVIAGPSGSGKTTLLTMMGLVLQPTTGTIKLRGREVSGISEDALARVRLTSIGFVFQQAALIPALSVLENILVAGTIQGAPVTTELRERAISLLDTLGLSDYTRAKPQQMSTGQQQRIAIARALANEPVLLLCDEPTSALDVESSTTVLDTLKEVSRDKTRSVVLVTHDPRVFPYGDRLIKLEDGVITYDNRRKSEGGGASGTA